MNRILALVLGSVLATSAASANAGTISCYKGEIKVRGTVRHVELQLDSDIQDQFAGDPDMEGHGFLFQDIPSFSEENVANCVRTLEWNGGYLRSCSDLYLSISDLVESPARLSGQVFKQEPRFDSQGRLQVPAIGNFEFVRSEHCGS